MGEQVPSMTLRSSILEGDGMFTQFQAIVPDFLGANKQRTPLHRAYWKKLWTDEPQSLPALEQQLTYLVEQALWAMGSNPLFDVPTGSDPAAQVPSGILEIMHENESGTTASKTTKKRGKKKKLGASESEPSCATQSIIDTRAAVTPGSSMDDNMASCDPHDAGVPMVQPRAALSMKSRREPKQKYHTNDQTAKGLVTPRQGNDEAPFAELEATSEYQATLPDEDVTSGSENEAALSHRMEIQSSFDGPDMPAEVPMVDDAEDGWEKVGSKADKKRNKHNAKAKIVELPAICDPQPEVPADVAAEGASRYQSRWSPSHAPVASPCRSMQHGAQSKGSLKGSLVSRIAFQESFEASTSIIGPSLASNSRLVSDVVTMSEQMLSGTPRSVPTSRQLAVELQSAACRPTSSGHKIPHREVKQSTDDHVEPGKQLADRNQTSGALDGRTLPEETLNGTKEAKATVDSMQPLGACAASCTVLPSRSEGLELEMCDANDAAENSIQCRTALVDPRFLQNLYWGSQDRRHTPGLQWCLPSGASTRGRWTQPQGSDALDEVAAVVRVVNTFITIEKTNEAQPVVRRSRSLSPSRQI